MSHFNRTVQGVRSLALLIIVKPNFIERSVREGRYKRSPSLRCLSNHASTYGSVRAFSLIGYNLNPTVSYRHENFAPMARTYRNVQILGHLLAYKSVGMMVLNLQ